MSYPFFELFSGKRMEGRRESQDLEHMENIHSKDYLEAMNVKSMKREKV
jgi:hypothetical protein